ncbi:MAG TPA: hypothetical protein VK947_13495 [Planococcus sp. (in: firmicutes)]|nr:hypothetical protein [Planococcus sp. (in: firmicutes)]
MIYEDDLAIKYHLELKKGTDLFYCRASCLLTEEEAEDSLPQTEVGYATLCLFNPLATSMEAVVMYADGISEKVSSVCEELKYIHGIEDVFGLVAVCHELTVVEGKRGEGIGDAFTKKLIDELKHLNVEILVMIPNYGSARSESEVKRAQSYYRKNGFHRLKKNDDETALYSYL